MALQPMMLTGLVALASPASFAAAAGGDSDPGVTAEEREAIERALGADEATDEDAGRFEPRSADGAGGPLPGALQSMNPELSVILQTALAYFSDAPLQSGAHDPGRTGFNLQQLELNFGASVDPFFRFDANLVFSPFGVEIEEAYGTTLGLPLNLQARAGIFLTRFGRLNPTHPHAWELIDQPLIIGRFFGPEASRGVGAELSYLIPIDWYAEAVVSATDAAGACCARSFFGGEDLGVSDPADLLYTLALEQFFPLNRDWAILWGLSGQLGPNPSGHDTRTDIYGTDVTVRYRPVDSPQRTSVTLQVEALYRRRQLPYELLDDYGGYAQLAWHIDPAWSTAARFDYVRALADDPLDPGEAGDRPRYSLSVAHQPSHFSRIRLQTNIDDPHWRERPIYAVFVALELVTGAHGAHAY